MKGKLIKVCFQIKLYPCGLRGFFLYKKLMKWGSDIEFHFNMQQPSWIEGRGKL